MDNFILYPTISKSGQMAPKNAKKVENWPKFSMDVNCINQSNYPTKRASSFMHCSHDPNQKLHQCYQVGAPALTSYRVICLEICQFSDTQNFSQQRALASNWHRSIENFTLYLTVPNLGQATQISRTEIVLDVTRKTRIGRNFPWI